MHQVLAGNIGALQATADALSAVAELAGAEPLFPLGERGQRDFSSDYDLSLTACAYAASSARTRHCPWCRHPSLAQEKRRKCHENANEGGLLPKKDPLFDRVTTNAGTSFRPRCAARNRSLPPLIGFPSKISLVCTWVQIRTVVKGSASLGR